MKKVTMIVMANLILPLHGQSLPGSKSPPKKINSKEAMSIIGGGATQDTAMIFPTADSKKKPKASVEDEKMFSILINTDEEKNKKALDAQGLNEMLAKGHKENFSLLLVKNSSDCNMVLQIEGSTNYKLPVPANGQNAMLLPKGIYQLKGNVCELRYEAQKDLNKNILVSLKRVED